MIVNSLRVLGEWKGKDIDDLMVGDVFAHVGSPVAYLVTHVAGIRGPDMPTYVRGYELTISAERVADLFKSLQESDLAGYFELILMRCFIGRVMKFKTIEGGTKAKLMEPK